MPQARNYAAACALRDGRRVKIRAIRPEDEAGLTEAVAGLKTFVAGVFPENAGMLKVFAKSGLDVKTTRDTDVVHVVMPIS